MSPLVPSSSSPAEPAPTPASAVTAASIRALPSTGLLDAIVGVGAAMALMPPADRAVAQSALIARIAAERDSLSRAGLVAAAAKALRLPRPEVRRVVEARVREAAKLSAPALELPEMVYDGSRYWRPIESRGKPLWQPLTRMQAIVHLHQVGFSRIADDGELSAAEVALDAIERSNYVCGAGRVGGVPAGRHVMCGSPILVTDSPRPIQPDPEGDSTPFTSFIRSLLGCDAGDPDAERQVHTFRLWLRQTLLSLYSFPTRIEMPILCLVGPGGQGKSLLAGLLAEMLGGTPALAYGYLVGSDDKNADVAAGSILVLGDEVTDGTGADRDRLAHAMKNWVSNPEARMRAMRQDAVTVTPRAPIFVSCNPGAEASLPAITDADFAQRIIYLKTYVLPRPLNDGTPASKEAMRASLVSALGREVADVLALRVENDPMHDKRWGVRAYHHPAIVAELARVDSGGPLSELLDLFFSGATLDDATRAALGFTSAPLSEAIWQGTASELYLALQRSVGRIDGWVRSPLHLGHALGRLSKSPIFGPRIRSKLGHASTTIWTIGAKPLPVLATQTTFPASNPFAA